MAYRLDKENADKLIKDLSSQSIDYMVFHQKDGSLIIDSINPLFSQYVNNFTEQIKKIEI